MDEIIIQKLQFLTIKNLNYILLECTSAQPEILLNRKNKPKSQKSGI